MTTVRVTGCDGLRVKSFRTKRDTCTLQIRNHICDSSFEKAEKPSFCHQPSREGSDKG